MTLSNNDFILRAIKDHIFMTDKTSGLLLNPEMGRLREDMGTLARIIIDGGETIRLKINRE